MGEIKVPIDWMTKFNRLPLPNKKRLDKESLQVIKILS